MHPTSFILSSLSGGELAAVTAAAGAPAPSMQNITLWEMLISAGWVMLPLALASVAAVALIVMCFLTLRRINLFTEHFINAAETYLSSGDMAGLQKLAKKENGALPRIMERALWFANNHPGADYAAVKEVATAEGVRQASRMSQLVTYLMDVGVLAPMLGLMGTVVGILRAFGNIATDSSPMRTMFLAGGVSQALVATAAGLLVGIVSMAFYSFFRGRVQFLTSELETQSTYLLEQAGLRLKKNTGTTPKDA